MRVQNPDYCPGSPLFNTLHFVRYTPLGAGERQAGILRQQMKLPQTEACRVLLFAFTCKGLHPSMGQLLAGWCLAPLPAYMFFADYYIQHPVTGKHFCLLSSKWRPKGVLRGEGKGVSPLVLEAPKRPMIFASYTLPWVIQPVTGAGGYGTALPWTQHLMQRDLTNHQFGVVREELNKPLKKWEKGRGKDRHYLGVGSELPLILLLWKKLSLKGEKHVSIFNSLNGKYAPDPALFTQDILPRELLI